MSRAASTLVYLLIAAQLLLVLPAAASSFSLASPLGADCAGMTTGEGDHCPCCPDGVTTALDCLASCAMAAAMVPSIPAMAVADVPAPPVSLSPTELAALDSPPLKPPPIG